METGNGWCELEYLEGKNYYCPFNPFISDFARNIEQKSPQIYLSIVNYSNKLNLLNRATKRLFRTLLLLNLKEMKLTVVEIIISAENTFF